MKRQKRSMLQRMMAALLTALLVVSIASNAVPVAVLAQEDTASSVSGGRQESTVGNTEEPAEGNTKPEEKAPAPAETTNPEEPTNAGGGGKTRDTYAGGGAETGDACAEGGAKAGDACAGGGAEAGDAEAGRGNGGAGNRQRK